ncbi:hypothetical protein [Telmatospirillum sp. J64-1]|uniref:hypothetical protein n=1 Tax=Telmatospirillum sp. J64-1 TaxID=2502183 RepID=UPI00115C84B0|nr:hypothetical protein [Telmatospirillum sp. J64-1]
MDITIIQEERPYRLISDGLNHFAVLEARCGHVYPVHCDRRHQRPGLLDTTEGMAVAARHDWTDWNEAAHRFRFMTENEERYAQILW